MKSRNLTNWFAFGLLLAVLGVLLGAGASTVNGELLGVSLPFFFIGGLLNRRDMKDAELTKSVALPTSAGTSTTASIDLRSGNPPGRAANDAELVIDAAIALGVDTKTHTFTLLESDDDSSFAAMAGQPTVVNTATAAGGPGGAAGFPALNKRIILPLTCKRYIKLQVVGNSGSGDSSASAVELSLRF